MIPIEKSGLQRRAIIEDTFKDIGDPLTKFFFQSIGEMYVFWTLNVWVIWS